LKLSLDLPVLLSPGIFSVNQLLETDSRQELHGRLNHVAQTRAFGVFTGDAGTGKRLPFASLARNWTSIGIGSSIFPIPL